MRLGKKRTIAAVLAAGLTLLLAGCGLAAPSTGGDATEGNGETVVIGTRLVAATLDPIMVTESNNDIYLPAMYDRVVSFDENAALVPALATEWEFSGDATKLSLTLRDDVTFHSGNHFTSADIIYTLDRAKKLGSGVGALLTAYESATAPDDTTVEITLNRPSLDFLNALSLVYVLDSEVVKPNEGGDMAQQWLSTNTAGSGTYILQDYQPNQQLQLTANVEHWDGRAAERPSTLVMRMITEASSIRDELNTGGIDIGYGVPTNELVNFEADPFRVIKYPAPRITLAMMNMESPIMSDPKVREAMQLAYDYDGHLTSALSGHGTQATSIVPNTLQCRVDVAPQTRDLDRAKQLIAESGLAGQTVSLAYQTVIPEHKMAGTLMEATLRELGFEVEVRGITYPQYVESVAKPETTPDIGIMWDLSRYPSASTTLKTTWTTAAINFTNFARYSNPQVDTLIDEGMAATDETSACDKFKQAQELIIADRPAVMIANPEVLFVANNRIADIAYTPVAMSFDPSKVFLAA